MKHEEVIELATLRFEGERFCGHAMDVDGAQEIVAYRAMVRECAMALWGKRRGSSAIVIPGFKDRFHARFNRVDVETATIRLELLASSSRKRSGLSGGRTRRLRRSGGDH